MRFVDRLNSMPSEESLARKNANKQFMDDLHGILVTIRGACTAQRNRRYAEGYIVRSYDGEYCVYGFRYLPSLSKDDSGHLSPSRYLPKGGKYTASLVSDLYHQKREGLKPISEDQNACQQYVSKLQPLLKADGFEVLCLESFACYEEYDIVKYKGLFNPTPFLERHKTNELLGYAIKFAVRW